MVINTTENIEGLATQIGMEQVELIQIEERLKGLEEARLAKVIESAKKGIKFQPIFKEKIIYNNHNTFRADQVEYFKDNNGKLLKGVDVATFVLTSNSSAYGGSKVKRELFLLEDGSFIVFIYISDESNWQDVQNRYTRDWAKNQDVFQFDIDEIINSIEWELKDRLEKLGSRKKAQLKRLMKLEKLKVS